MKLLILHLSDIHFDKKNDITNENIEGIKKVFNKITDIDAALIVISGDIAFSGKKEQYDVAWKLFRNIKNVLINKNNIEKVDFAIVPGNHDIDYDAGERSYQELVNLHNLGQEDLYLNDEKQKMLNFYNHANGLECFKKRNEIVYTKKLKYKDCSVKLNLINTAIYSLKKDEDQGFHYLPENEMNKIIGKDEDDFVFTVMHHPHHWYNENIRKKLEKRIYENSDVIFMGHEHYASTQEIKTEYSQVKICAGGELANKGNWTKSEFYLGTLNTNDRNYNIEKYIWDIKEKIYKKSNTESVNLNKNRENKFDLSPQKKYYEEMFRDDKYLISNDISNYYVFPRIEEEIIDEKRPAKEFLDIDSFIAEIFEKKKIIVLGRSGSGKTVLLKQIFKRINREKCILYVKPEHFLLNDFESVYQKGLSRRCMDLIRLNMKNLDK